MDLASMSVHTCARGLWNEISGHRHEKLAIRYVEIRDYQSGGKVPASESRPTTRVSSTGSRSRSGLPETRSARTNVAASSGCPSRANRMKVSAKLPRRLTFIRRPDAETLSAFGSHGRVHACA